MCVYQSSSRCAYGLGILLWINLFPNQQKFQDDTTLRIARNLSVQPAYLSEFKSSGSGQCLRSGTRAQMGVTSSVPLERVTPQVFRVSLQTPSRCSLGTRV